MEQNNNISGSDYAFPQNKEQFKQVLKQAKEGQYRQQRPFEPVQEKSRQPVWDKYSAYAESLSRHPEPEPRPQQAETQLLPEAPEPKRKKARKQPNRSNRPTTVKRKFNPLVVIIPLILLIAAAAVIFFFYLNSNVSYRKAEENYFIKLFQNITEAKNDFWESDTPLKADIKVTVPAAGLAGIDIGEISFTADSIKKDGIIYGMLNADLGGEKASLESWIDPTNGMFTAVMPEVSDIYLRFGSEDYTEMYRDIIVKTADTYFELAGEPEAEKGVEFTADGDTFTADRYRIHLDGVQLATLERTLLVNTLANDTAVSVICRETGCENKDELMENKSLKAIFDELEQIIIGEKNSANCADMTVYIKNKTVIGREIAFTEAEVNTQATNPENTPQAESDYNKKLFLNIYEIPSEKNRLTHFYCKSVEKENTSALKEFYITCRDQVSSGNIHFGSITANLDSNTVNVEYSNLAAKKELFQGKLNMTWINNPALSMTAELKKDGDVKVINLSVPNIVNADVALTPSELVFKDRPELAEGEYAVLSGNSEDQSEEAEIFMNDLAEFVHKILETEPYEDDKTSTPENETGILVKPTEPEGSDTSAPEKQPEETQTTAEKTAPTEAVPPETTAAETTPDATEPPAVTTAPSYQQIYHAPSTLDTGDAQKIKDSGLDSFNSGNYYTAEIYVDGNYDAGGNLSISELKGEFDGYIKGKVLQIDFAEGYDFDSALVVLTFPHSTISGGRHYPYSDALKGLDRYLVLGSQDGTTDNQIECYKYSDDQIGFIVEGSGYYYVVDLDRYFYEEFGVSPEGLDIA